MTFSIFTTPFLNNRSVPFIESIWIAFDASYPKMTSSKLKLMKKVFWNLQRTTKQLQYELCLDYYCKLCVPFVIGVRHTTSSVQSPACPFPQLDGSRDIMHFVIMKHACPVQTFFLLIG